MTIIKLKSPSNDQRPLVFVQYPAVAIACVQQASMWYKYILIVDNSVMHLYDFVMFVEIFSLHIEE